MTSITAGEAYLQRMTRFCQEMREALHPEQANTSLPESNPFIGKVVSSFCDTNQRGELFRRAIAAQMLYIEAVKQGRSAERLYTFLCDPRQELVQMGGLAAYVTLPPALSECSCACNTFNRNANTRRNDIEAQLLKDVTTAMPVEQPLRYLSLGTGGGLQDFINVGKLIQAGYRHIEVMLVDPKFKDRQALELQAAQFDFLQVVAAECGISLSIAYETSIHSVSEGWDIISAVDFERFEEHLLDLQAAHQKLSARGKYYLSSGQLDLILDHKQCIQNHWHTSGPPVGSRLQQRGSHPFYKRSHLALLGNADNARQWFQYIPYLARPASVERFQVTIIQPAVRDYFGRATECANAQATQKTLGYWLTLLSGKPVDVTLVPSLQAFQAKGEEHDIIAYLFQGGYTWDIVPSIRLLMQAHRESEFYFACAARAGVTRRYDEDCISCRSQPDWEAEWRWTPGSGVQFLDTPSEDSKRKVARLMESARNTGQFHELSLWARLQMAKRVNGLQQALPDWLMRRLV